jgi:filamentous hemagglutinin family protein
MKTDRFGIVGSVSANIGLCLIVSGAISFWASQSIAQIRPDATLGAEGSVMTPNVDIRGVLGDRIDGGAVRGANLFHSFLEFNVGNGQRVYFANPTGIENILSRVTGNNLSNILGTLGVDGGANLFFINPNGILFGANSQLDISGSFVASTANSVVFNNGYQFSTQNPDTPPLLTVNVPLGVQYGANQPRATISNAGNLAVGSGRTLTLYGSTVTSTGSLTAPGGTVEVLGDHIGLFDNARINASAPSGGGTVLIGGDFQGKGEVPNATRTFIGSNVSINADAIANGDGGRVIIWSDEATRFYGNITARGGVHSGNGGFVEVSGKQFLDYNGFTDTRAPFGATGTLLLDPTNIVVVAVGGETGNLLDVDAFADPDIGTPGDTTLNVAAINLATANVTLQATQNITFSAPVNILTLGVGLTAQAGNNITVNSPITTFGGAIQLTANDVTSGTPSGTGSIFINANIQSLGGLIALSAGGNLSVNGAAVLTSGLFGNSGDLSITTGGLTVQNLGRLSTGTFGNGNAGNINIQASEIDLIAPDSPFPVITGISSLANPGSTGDAGNITIATERLTVRNGAQISSGTVGSGRAGDVNVRASEIELTGVLSANGFPTGILADSNAGSTGNAGTITIETGSLITRDGGGIFVSTESAGNGGALNIQASSIELSGSGSTYPSGLIAQAFPGAIGDAGQITIDTGRLLIRDRARVTADASVGQAGNLLIQATDSIDILNRGFLISVSDGIGAGGDLVIATRNLNLQDGFIYTGATTQGNGGTIAISSSESVTMTGTSFISTGALNSGSGGNLSLDTGTLTMSDQSAIITSSFSQGNSGNLRLRATNAVNITGAGVVLSTGNLGTGNGGTMEIETGQMLVSDQAEVSTFSFEGNAGNLTIRTGQLKVRDGATVATSTETGNAGNLTIQATEFVNLDGGLLLAASTVTGSGGTIAMDTRNLTLQNGGQIQTGTIDRGNAGNIIINSLESVTVSGYGSGISAISFGSGTGGNLAVNTGTLTLRDGGSIVTSTAGQGSAGNLTVNAANAVNVIDSGLLSTGTLGTGAGGNLSIATRNLNIQNFGRVFTSSFDASTFDFSILDPNVYPPDAIERIRNSVNTAAQGNFTQGNSGNLTVSATDSVSVANSGTLATLAFGQASGGLLFLETGQLTIEGDSVVSSSAFGQGDGGDIQLQLNSFNLTTSGLLASRSEGLGKAGDMLINVRDDLRSSQGDIVATSDQAGGGDINITARNIRLQDDSLISTSVFDSTGGGGNITINSETFVILGDTDILANAAAGPGGDITINSPAFLIALFSTNQATAVGRNPGDLTQFRGNNRVDISDNFVRIDDSDRIPIFGDFNQLRGNNRTDISTASQSGIDGIQRTSPINNTQPVAQAPLNLVNPEELIDRRCTPNSTAKNSSFTITGRGGLPPSPTDPLTNEEVWVEWITLEDTKQSNHQTVPNPNPSSSTPQTLVEAQGWEIDGDGKVILTAQAPNATPQDSWRIPDSCQRVQVRSLPE